MSWLVTGGAGYIGAHIVRALATDGLTPVVLDDLSSGVASFVPDGVAFVRGSILDRELVESALRDHDVTGVIHVAGYKYAGVSVQRPLHTYEQNVDGTRVVLAAMAAANVTNLVFSSSAAVYGTPDVPLVTEDLPKRPASPYGESKLIGEWLIRDQGIATAGTEHPLRHTSLRYFNVVGSGDPSVYDVSPHNLFPIVFEKLIAGEVPRINGDDYDTPDGTNVRDYVHVADIASAHVVAARRLAAGEPVEPAYNLGSQNGLSVKEIMTAVARVTGVDFAPEIGPRRSGDPDRIVATGDLAARDLDWRMRYTVDEMVRSGWDARRAATAPA
ncbi:MAG: UDP-glucose 4-epimerase GalE [Microbacterium sp.]|jgi:UDP-glucose 4-epimerase|uniref:UDP-glucose 4-epimerase n=1 Tax=Microbacterium ginsengisoli TaxID=400772 RepID=A0A3C1KFG9_9MICO|nr:UDP-glucose 4-epimerase GalE [Microbacterium sp. SCN 71-21]MAL07333.1 UDP-glucose 4-epimerase GalE [Microbacterium sp.]MBN9207230.1 UDP-glucose 4-epimerase GalE [Microbacterium ginsengisoli]ODU76683.1 MAG: UDP-glucose 4-epimerase GalE [Microbacterium sp. SCN 71-21]HAN25411.1 UDP-glucose 4-epimerase GalE [Microbacterium ginsengisoli]